MNKLLFVFLVIFLAGCTAPCPPKGPWPMPPWCESNGVVINDFVDSAQENISSTEKSINFFNASVNDSIIINSNLLGNDYIWVQIFMPEMYEGNEYYSGNIAILNSTDSKSVVFSANYPGVYAFNVSSGNISEIIKISVNSDSSLFDVKGFAVDFWHYTDDSLNYLYDTMVNETIKLNGNIIMISPSFYMPNNSAVTMSLCPESVNPSVCRGVYSDELLVEMIRKAHNAGLLVMVKPHLKVAGLEYPEWPGSITPNDWSEWFINYESMVVHYANISEAEGVEHFSIGNELSNSLTYTAEWKHLISEVRKFYFGLVSYHGFLQDGELPWCYPSLEAEFWDDLDYIGVNYYAPGSGEYGFSRTDTPNVDDMFSLMNEKMKDTVDVLVNRTGLPVIITEFGAGSYDGTNFDQFVYVDITDNKEQAEYIEASLRTFNSRNYIDGVIYWALSWEPYVYDNPTYRTMNIASRPAADMIKYWYE